MHTHKLTLRGTCRLTRTPTHTAPEGQAQHVGSLVLRGCLALVVAGKGHVRGHSKLIRGHFDPNKHLHFVPPQYCKGEHAFPPGLQENVCGTRA